MTFLPIPARTEPSANPDIVTIVCHRCDFNISGTDDDTYNALVEHLDVVHPDWIVTEPGLQRRAL